MELFTTKSSGQKGERMELPADAKEWATTKLEMCGRKKKDRITEPSLLVPRKRR
jgi:hypothetical protein